MDKIIFGETQFLAHSIHRGHPLRIDKVEVQEKPAYVMYDETEPELFSALPEHHPAVRKYKQYLKDQERKESKNTRSRSSRYANNDQGGF